MTTTQLPKPPVAPPPPARTPSPAPGVGGGGGGGIEFRKFVAPSMNECLNRVKSEFGAQAVVLQTRTVQTRRFLGLVRREHVEVTAGRGFPQAPRRIRPARREAPVEHAPTGSYGPADPKALLNTPAAATTTYLGVQREVGELKGIIADLAEQVKNGRTPDWPPHFAAAHRSLVAAQVSEGRARDTIDSAHKALPPERRDDAAAVREAVRREVASRLPVAGGIGRGVRRSGKPHVVALVGPTGVGKTTTIAKLAATLKLRDGASVALITIDTYRIAAIDQLRKYAEIIDAPVQVVSSPREIADAVARVADHDYVLIDTAGRSPRDEAKLRELRDFLAAAKPAETHLVLSTVCGREAMLLAASRFAGVKADKLALTKLDEAADVGAAVDLAAATGLPLSYFTAGQDVPDDIEVADAAKLAALILPAEGGEK